MSNSLHNILNKTIKSKDRIYFYECYNRAFYRDHHIGMQSKFKLIQSGGYQYKYKENDIEYTVELYEPDGKINKVNFFHMPQEKINKVNFSPEPEYDKTDSDYEYINKYIYVYKTISDIKAPCSFGSFDFAKPSPFAALPCCSILSYYNNETLHIDILETPVKCIKMNEINKDISKELINTKKSYGDIMMKIIIKIARERNFNNIKLEDKSIFTSFSGCLDSKNKLKYSLKNVYTLTKGYPWYYKYGFKFIFDRDKAIVKKIIKL